MTQIRDKLGVAYGFAAVRTDQIGPFIDLKTVSTTRLGAKTKADDAPADYNHSFPLVKIVKVTVEKETT